MRAVANVVITLLASATNYQSAAAASHSQALGQPSRFYALPNVGKNRQMPTYPQRKASFKAGHVPCVLAYM